MIKPFDLDNNDLCNQEYLRGCFENLVKDENSNQNAEIFILEIDSLIREKYEEKSEIEKAYFIKKLNSLLRPDRKANLMEETESYWNRTGKNSSDYLIQFIEIIEAITDYHFSNNRKNINLTISESSDDLLDYNEKRQNIRIVFLKELGVLDYLKDKYKIKDINKLAQLLSTFTGIKVNTIQPNLNPIFKDGCSQANNPCTDKNIEYVKKCLTQIGIYKD